MMGAEIKNPVGAGFGGATDATNNLNNNDNVVESQALPPFTKSQERLLEMTMDDLVHECQEAKFAGWSSRYLKQQVWAAFWHCSYLPKVHSLLARVDSAVLEVFGAEPVLDFDTRREYWQSKNHPSPELAAASEVNGDKLTSDLHKQAAHARGDIPAIPDINHIITRCPQMARVYALGGNVSEPIWWASLSITERCEPNLSVDFSDGYPNYTDNELQQRIERIHNDDIKPATCARFVDLHPCGCKGCKFKGIHSPMALAYQHAPKVKKGGAR